MNRRYVDEEELYYNFIDNGVQESPTEIKLPAVAVSYTNDAVKASNYNYTPATLSFFGVVGQLVKDMIAIPSGINVDDTRLQVLWLQTSGTGKSTLTNWYMPIIDETFRIINEKHGTNFTVFDITDYTDAALIGSFERRKEEVEDEDGRTRTIEVDVPVPGQLDGEGMAIWDEFEYSGVFKQSQHKENAIVYLNTFMNTMWGETYIISKKLKQGEDPIECICKRSVYGTSYIPKTLTSVITEKGVLQRLLIFIWEVPQDVQKKMRRKLISDFGDIQEKEAPKLKYAKSLATIYDTVKERFDEVDANGSGDVDPAEHAAAQNDQGGDCGFKMGDNGSVMVSLPDGSERWLMAGEYNMNDDGSVTINKDGEPDNGATVTPPPCNDDRGSNN